MAKAGAEERRARLAAALRENLKRRKAHGRKGEAKPAANPPEETTATVTVTGEAGDPARLPVRGRPR